MKQKGFTLIEMIVTIMLLAILASTAIPKFINLSDEAKAAAVGGVAAEISSQGQLNFAGYQLSGIFDFGTSAPATSSKVVSTSSAITNACMMIVSNQFNNVLSNAASLPGGISIASGTFCQGSGLSKGAPATCTVFSITSPYISKATAVPCTD